MKVEYSDIKKPVTSLKEAVELKQFHPTRFPPVVVGDPEGIPMNYRIFTQGPFRFIHN